jgi:NTP pyrophosphatase (non-canonical NTP hydrolase)
MNTPAQNLLDRLVATSINEQVKHCHEQACKAGWHAERREDGTMLMLIVSEIAEAMEGERKDLMDDHLPHRRMAEVELADAVIRIFDYCGLHGYDLGGAFVEKLAYNRSRADHKPEQRRKAGGKKW